MLTDLLLQLNTLPWFQHVEFGPISKALILSSSVLLIWGLLRILRRKKSASKGFRAMGYGMLIGLGTLAFLLVDAQLNRYPILLPEREILEISFSQNQAQSPNQAPFLVHMRSIGSLGDGTKVNRKWPIQGGQWRLTARVLMVPGLPPRARLHRLITRSETMHDADEPQRAYVLNDNESPDLWRFLHKRIGLKDDVTRITTTDFLPIRVGDRYLIALTDSEIGLRAQEDAAQITPQ